MPATYEDLVALDLPEWQIGEIVDGALFVRRLPPPIGTLAYSALKAIIGSATWTTWRILGRVELCLSGDVLVPDISGWRAARMPVIPNTPWLDVVPDWVCDVVTPTSREIVEKKLAVYARHGIASRWTVDPETRVVKAHSLSGLTLFRGSEIFTVAPFEEVEIDLALLWGAPA